MKTFVLLSLFALTGSFVCGQKIAEPNSANGFKMFKLGTSKNLYTDYIKNSHYNETRGTYSVEVNKFPSLTTAFGSDVSTISLHFDKNDNLESITIPYRLLSMNKNPKEIIKEAEMTFGAPSDTSVDDLGVRNYKWVAKKVVLTINIQMVSAKNGDYWYREAVFQNYPGAMAGKKSPAGVFCTGVFRPFVSVWANNFPGF